MLLCLVSAAACEWELEPPAGEPTDPPPQRPPDGGRPDGGAPDAGLPDSGAADAGREPEPPPDPFDPSTLRETLSYLAAPERGGRSPGSAGDLATRALIEERFRALGLEPGNASSYQQPFRSSEGDSTANVIGVLHGEGPSLLSEIIVVGAHHDHVGTSSGGTVYPGANDNASGTTTLLAVAEALAHRPARPRRTIVFAAFGAEELGLEGSWHMVDNPPSSLPIERIVYMVNLDMVGTYRSEGRVYATGAYTSDTAYAFLGAEGAARAGFDMNLDTPGERSDFEAFCYANIPYVFFYTSDDRCYHQPCDTADRIDYEGMATIGEVTAALVWEMANTEIDLAAARSCSDRGR